MRRLDTREPHTCSSGGESTCRNILIDLKLSSGPGVSHSIQCKCIDVNPVRTEQIAVGALDPYVRIYDIRLCSLKAPVRTAAMTHGDPSCIAFLAPGHLTSSIASHGRGCSGGTVASTYVEFSPNGRELLVNLSGEQVHLYDLADELRPLVYNFDKTDSSSVTVSRPSLRTSRRRHSNGIRTRLKTVSGPHSLAMEEKDVEPEVIRLKNSGKELYQDKKMCEALVILNQAISLCPNWHTLYFLRGTTLYSRKW